MAAMRSFFHRLRWQLAATFVVASVVTAFLLSSLLALIALLVFFCTPLLPMAMQEETVVRVAPRVALFWEEPAALHQYLTDLSGSLTTKKQGMGFASAPPPFYSFSIGLNPERGHRFRVLVRDTRRNVRAVMAIGERPDTPLLPAEETLCEYALSGSTDWEKLSGRLEDGTAVAAAPVKNAVGEVLGTVAVRLYVPFRLSAILGDFAGHTGQILLFTFVVTGIPAVGGGVLAARAFTRRLQPIREAVDQWGQGDFRVSAPEGKGDELGQFACQLNTMRQGLSETLQLRRDLAAIEERQRLARDLHDTVKQEVFALCMHLSALQSAPMPDEMREKIAHTERIALRAQQELNTVIAELSPFPVPQNQPAPRTLLRDLRELVDTWAAQSGIVAEFFMPEEAPGISGTDSQHLLRIAREALANIERHSDATRVTVSLNRTGRFWQLTITDNGKGITPATSTMPTSTMSSGRGLSHMQERAQALSEGAFEWRNQEQGGLQIRVTFTDRKRG
ncbi:MAG: hypothetical protein OHK0029_22890 [Armatimonadaceae bacterium]